MLRPDRPWVASAGASSSVSLRRASGAFPAPRGTRRRCRSRRVACTKAALTSDPYEVLGVSSDASIEEIKLAYRKRTKALHPDVNPSPNAAESFRRVNRAYAVVSDASRRSLFDLGRDLEARDEGFAPDGETRRRAAKARYGSASPGNAGPEDGYWDDVRGGSRRDGVGVGVGRNVGKEKERSSSNPFGVVLDDAALRERGRRREMFRAARDAWTAWCSAWFVALTVAVPLGAAYFAAYGIAAGLNGGGTPMLER